MKTISGLNYTPLYDSVEDRIRLIVNYQDYENRVDLMLTRAFILKLIPFLEEFLENNCKDLTEEETSLENSSSNKSSYEDIELYKKNEELVIKLDLSYKKDLNLIDLAIESKNYRVNSTLTCLNFKNFIQLIKNSIPYTNWGIAYTF